jgi:hypothetical protein
VALLAGAVIAVRTVEALLSSVHKQVLRQVALSAGAVNRSAHSGSASRQCARVGASSGRPFGWRGNRSAHSGSASPQCARAGVSSGCSFGCRRGNRSAHSGSASPPATSADVHIQCHQRLLDVYRCTPRRSIRTFLPLSDCGAETLTMRWLLLHLNAVSSLSKRATVTMCRLCASQHLECLAVIPGR